MHNISYKAELRRNYQLIRQKFVHQHGSKYDTQILKKAYEIISRSDKNRVIAFYAPIKDELNLMPLLELLYSEGYKCCLPVIQQKDRELIFREYKPGEELIHGKYHRILEPASTNKQLTPDIIITPFLAVDHKGNRVGFGKGYYDRTIAHLIKQCTRPATLVIGYSCQVSKINFSSEAHDVAVDYIITEKHDLQTLIS